MERFKELLPENARQEFSSLVNEGRLLVRTLLHAGLDAAFSASRTMASVVTMREILFGYSLLVFPAKSRILFKTCLLRIFLCSQTRWTASSMG